ncbi:LOW QUALITY PROTEIN: myomesin-3 [Osmerus mordax]|uniref:LOW QUALITY PROTEIN: myomesin-3 n=1 Tax=Osmerus mordax TaxID=8014 RepID=UPI00350EEEEC
MTTRTVMQRVQEEQSSQMSHSMQLSSQKKKKTFTSSDEEASYADYYPIIPGDLMSVKEILNIGKFPCNRTWEVLQETLAEDGQHHRDKWTLFGNEAEKVEVEVIRNQQQVRKRVDRQALRRQAEQKASLHLQFLEDLSQKAPAFSVPLRAHSVWEGMGVTLSCTLQGHPAPRLTWYKDGELLSAYGQPWNHKLLQKFGLNSLEIRRCSAEDAGEYKVVARSILGEATTFATLVVNSHQAVEAGLQHSRTPVPVAEVEAGFGMCFGPSWVKEGDSLTLQVTFSSTLLPFQQDLLWCRDEVQLRASSRVELQTSLRGASLTLHGVQKEQEGCYALRLPTREGLREHRAYVCVRDASSVVPGGPGAPLCLQVSDVNRDYMFLTWQPPSAEGSARVEGYFIERCVVGLGQWSRCNSQVQKLCCYPVIGLQDSTIYQFRVCAVNQSGVGRASKPSEPVITTDPLEPSRTMVVKVDRGREITITKDQLEGQVRVPLPPTGVYACDVSDTYLVLSWAEPDPRGRETLTYYVERSLAGRSSWQLTSLDQTVSSPRFPVFDLQRGVAYEFRVRSVNKYGVSDPSTASPPLTLGDALAPPAPPHGIQAVRDSDLSVLLQWEEPAKIEGILGYYLYYSEAGRAEWRTVNNKPLTSTRFTVHGLKAQKEYVFRVKSVSRAGTSRYSDESPPILVKSAVYVPGPPSAIALVLCRASEMVLSWRAPACSGGSPVGGYYLDRRDQEQQPWKEVNTRPARERQYTVCNLSEGVSYQFRVFASNVVGVGQASLPSPAFLCEDWSMEEPGPPYELEIREVRNDSLVLLWVEPLYGGQSPIKGYLLEISEGSQSETWTPINQEATPDTFFKVSGLKTGHTYRLRVLAVNQGGVGCPSLPSEPITAQTSPDTRDVEVGVDSDGFLFLSWEGAEPGQLVWRRSYREEVEAGRARVETRNNRCVLTFLEASEQDLGLYTLESSDPTTSSSYTFTAEDLERLTELSWNIRNPLIGLRSGWQVEVGEKGGVRLWMQTESLTSAAELCLILNDREISSTAARKVTLDRGSGVVEVLLEPLGEQDQGSYTAQLRDGRARNQFTLLLVDHKFRQTLAQSQANRLDYKRKSGPYFQKFLSWLITEQCELIISCRVTNANRDTVVRWFKDGVEISSAVYEPSSGDSSLTIPQVTKKEAGTFRAVVSDSRGQDVSTLEMLEEEYDKLLQHLSKQCALSASPLRVQCTAEGFKLYCSLRYYLSCLKTSWSLQEKRIDQDPRAKPGCSMQKLWLQILAPTESDKGKYTLEMSDGQETHKRSLDLSGQVFADALLEFQRLKQVAVAEKNCARVTKGLPDVVAIMENKSLCLTCFADGDPAPEMFWLRNDREIVSGGQFSVTKEPKSSTLTVNNVTSQDSGRYSIFVRNQHGSQTVNVTVSVYKHGEKPPLDAVEME